MHEDEALATNDAGSWVSSLIDSPHFATIAMDLDWKTTVWNASAERIFGYSARDVIGEELTGLIVPEGIRPDVRVLLRSTVQHDRGLSGRNENITKDGRQIFCHWFNAPIHDDAGRVVGLGALAQDVTDLIRAESRLNATLDAAPDALIGVNKEGKIHTFNSAAERLFGRAAADVLDRSFAVLFPERLAEDCRDYVQQYLSSGQRLPAKKVGDLAVKRKSGDEIPVQMSLSKTIVLEDPEVVVCLRDISNVQETTERIQHREDLLTEISRRARIGTWEFDQRTDKLSWSDEVYDIHELDRGEPVTLDRAVEFYAPQARGIVRDAVRRGLTDGSGWDMELPLITSKGALRWVHAVGRVDKGPGGKPRRLFGTFQDLTPFRETAAAFKLDSERLKLAARSARLGIWEWNVETGRLDLDDLMLDIYGIEKASFGHRYEDWRERIVDEDYPRVQDDFAQAAQGSGHFESRFRIRRPDGTIRATCSRAIAQYDDDGALTRLVGVSWDATADEYAEKRLRLHQKMEALGRLTGGLAHDFNNLMGSVRLNLESALDQLHRDDDAAELLRRSLAAISRGSNLTWSLLTFAKRQELQPAPLRLRDVVEEMREMLTGTLGNRITLQLDLQDYWLVSVDPALLQAAVLNLTLNARDAMPGGGTLTIRTKHTLNPDDRRGAGSDAGCDADHVALRFEDTGIGIPSENLDKVFDPFFSDKPSNIGSGLGLSMVHGFVEQSGGDIRIDSEPGQGTTVTMTWPRTQSRPVDVDVSQNARRPGQRVRRALVVEDDQEFLRGLRRLLVGLGIDCVTAETAKEAIAMLNGDPEIDVVLSDVVLRGGRSGVEVASAAATCSPPIPSILMSGYPAESLPEELSNFNGQVLRKPFGRQEFAARLAQL